MVVVKGFWSDVDLELICKMWYKVLCLVIWCGSIVICYGYFLFLVIVKRRNLLDFSIVIWIFVGKVVIFLFLVVVDLFGCVIFVFCGVLWGCYVWKVLWFLVWELVWVGVRFLCLRLVFMWVVFCMLEIGRMVKWWC